MTDERSRRDIGKVRISIARHLRDIEQLALDLHAQALNTPNARDFPGGTALHMLGPAASIAAWEAQYEATEEAERWDDNGNDRWAKRPKLDPALYQGDAEEHPLNVLESWTRIWREEFDQPTKLKPTISREVDYLRKTIDRVCEVDEFGDPVHLGAFEMAEELNTLVRRMEDVLHDGIRVERTETPCINDECEAKPRLVKVWGYRAVSDGYKCPACRLPYDQAQYLQAKAANLRSQSSEKWVLATDATDALELPVQTMRAWIRRETVNTKWIRGRLHVWWPDARDAAEARRLAVLTKAARNSA